MTFEKATTFNSRLTSIVVNTGYKPISTLTMYSTINIYTQKQNILYLRLVYICFIFHLLNYSTILFTHMYKYYFYSFSYIVLQICTRISVKIYQNNCNKFKKLILQTLDIFFQTIIYVISIFCLMNHDKCNFLYIFFYHFT